MIFKSITSGFKKKALNLKFSFSNTIKALSVKSGLFHCGYLKSVKNLIIFFCIQFAIPFNFLCIFLLTRKLSIINLKHVKPRRIAALLPLYTKKGK